MQHPTNSFRTDTLIENKKNNITIKVARLDLIHPIVSGNKLFKLFYFIEKALQQHKKNIVTKGGAYSNHLIATAYYCKEKNLHSIGIIRGEQPLHLNHTLNACKELGMKLIFVPRKIFDGIQNINQLKEIFHADEDSFFIPEGGYHPLGASGASLIMTHPDLQNASHICTALGTSTTLAGLIMKSTPAQQIIAIPALKGLLDVQKRLDFLLENSTYTPPIIWNEYHFGGYAKSTPELFDFMNRFYANFQIPSDFVYTGKAFYAVMDKLENGYFPVNSNIVIIHTGGLQGNQSISETTFIF